MARKALESSFQENCEELRKKIRQEVIEETRAEIWGELEPEIREQLKNRIEREEFITFQVGTEVRTAIIEKCYEDAIARLRCDTEFRNQIKKEQLNEVEDELRDRCWADAYATAREEIMGAFDHRVGEAVRRRQDWRAATWERGKPYSLIDPDPYGKHGLSEEHRRAHVRAVLDTCEE